MAVLKFKIEIAAETKDIQKALKNRGITVNRANTNRFIKMIQSGSFFMKPELYEDFPKDRETLLMHGFTFQKNKGE